MDNNCSNTTLIISKNQDSQRTCLIQECVDDCVICLVVRLTAKKEISKKTRSKLIHHEGAAAQQLAEQAEAINRKGVAAQ